MAKKPDYSETNIPSLKSYCENNDLTFDWKDVYNGHAVITGRGVEAYVWVQRMVICVRIRQGRVLSKPLYERTKGFKFNGKLLDKLLLKGEKTTSHVTRHGIRVTRRPAKKVS